MEILFSFLLSFVFSVNTMVSNSNVNLQKIFDENNKLTYHNGWWHGSNAVFVHLLKSKVTIIAIGNKYSQRVYSAMALSGLFEPFPFEVEKLNKVMNGDHPTNENADSANVNHSNYSE